MALLQTIHLEHLPPSYDVHVALFRDVKNASFLHQQLLAGNTDFEYALIDASVVSCPSSSSLSRIQPLYILYSQGIHLFSLESRDASRSSRRIYVLISYFCVILNKDLAYQLLVLMLTTRDQIISKIHALSATYRAVNDFLSSRLKSRNVHSEIVYSLSPNNNVCALLLPQQRKF